MRRLLLAFALGLFAPLPAVASDISAQLVMVEEDGCVWCELWDEEIKDIYPKTAEGRAAPLRKINIQDPLPEDLTIKAPLVYTPTFLLVVDGQEVARLEGYAGEDFFWGMLGKILRENIHFTGDS